jgi:hypothetical protein
VFIVSDNWWSIEHLFGVPCPAGLVVGPAGIAYDQLAKRAEAMLV